MRTTWRIGIEWYSRARMAIVRIPRAAGSSSPASVAAFGVMPEIVEDPLPAGTLHFSRVLRFRVEGRADEDAVGLLDEFGLHLATVVHAVLDRALRFDARIDAAEVEADAAVLRLHARDETAAGPQVDLAACRVPVVLRRVPSLDVLGRVPRLPDAGQTCVDEGLD